MTLVQRWLLGLGSTGWLIIAIPACSSEVTEEPVLTGRGDAGALTSRRRLEEAARVHNREAALESDRALAEQGDAAAQARLGAAYFRGDGVARDFQEALRWSRLAVEQDNAHGQAVLAAAYNTGHGVAQDTERALYWARLAAEQGNAFGQAVLAILYMSGSGGLAQDYAEAVRWARLAAEQDNGDGQAVLGTLYGLGLGAEKDAVSAYMWLTLSTSHPWIEGARQVRDNLAASMTPEQIAEAEARVHDWKERRSS